MTRSKDGAGFSAKLKLHVKRKIREITATKKIRPLFIGSASLFIYFAEATASARSRQPRPNPINPQTANASHSYPLKWPGIAGTIFINIIPKPTATPTAATSRSRGAGPMQKYAAQAASHPAADATDPTSEIGTRMASPRNMQAAVATPTQITATDGVRFLGCTVASLRSTNPRRPIAKSKRLAATRFPLNTLKRERSAATRMTRTIQCEPVAYSKATAVMNFSPVNLLQGAAYATAAITIV